MAADNASQVQRRELVLCCDGTNNTLTGGHADTNVVLLYRYLLRQPSSNGIERLLWYDPGVGNPDTLPPADFSDAITRVARRVAGLASGRGVYENIAEGYLFLMRNWRGAQDPVYLFGFSRGAFTARAIAGMVNLFGILRPEHDTLVPTLLHIYFSLPAQGGAWRARLLRGIHRRTGRKYKASAEIGPHPKSQPEPTREDLAREVREMFAGDARSIARVHWIGVWDTVESVGMPGPFSQSNPATATFSDKRFDHVRHALALDEHRWPFLPRLYQEPGDINVDGRTLKQRWFPGVHCDVGGSYDEGSAGLSDAALRWMLRELSASEAMAIDAEQSLHPLPADAHAASALQPAPKVRHDPLWDTPWWALAGMVVRDMRPHVQAPGRPPDPIPVIDEVSPDDITRTVWARRRDAWPLMLAIVVGAAATLLSGISLLAPEQRAWDFRGLSHALDATGNFAYAQLGSFIGGGLLGDGLAPWLQGGQPGWGMVWDLVFLVCWSYVLARIASRAFVWLAGEVRPGQPAPWWRGIGFAPMLAVFGNVGQDLCTLAALGLHGMGTDLAAQGLLWLASLGSAAKFCGLVASLPLLLLRSQIATHPHNEWPSIAARKDRQLERVITRHRHRISSVYGTVLAAFLAWLIWTWARLTVCTGGHAWIGDLACNAHFAGVPLVLVSGGLFIWLVADVLRGTGSDLGADQSGRPIGRFDNSHRWHVGITGALTIAVLAGLAWLSVSEWLF